MPGTLCPDQGKTEMRHAPQTQTILIIEDNDDDFEAVERAIRNTSSFDGLIERCASGQEALNILTSGHITPPALIILDLNLPGLTGREVLVRIKNDECLRVIPVIAMTSSTDPRDIDACYRAGANAYLQKPMDLNRLFTAVAQLTGFWLDTAILPA